MLIADTRTGPMCSSHSNATHCSSSITCGLAFPIQGPTQNPRLLVFGTSWWLSSLWHLNQRTKCTAMMYRGGTGRSGNRQQSASFFVLGKQFCSIQGLNCQWRAHSILTQSSEKLQNAKHWGVSSSFSGKQERSFRKVADILNQLFLVRVLSWVYTRYTDCHLRSQQHSIWAMWDWSLTLLFWVLKF